MRFTTILSLLLASMATVSHAATLAYGWSVDGGQTWGSQRIDFSNIPSDVLTADPTLVFALPATSISDCCVTTCSIVWTHTTAADSYSVSRGLLSTLATGQYGPCLVDGVDLEGVDDDTLPPSGDGFFSLVQGYNSECGLGSLGFASDENSRVNADSGACIGALVPAAPLTTQ